MVQERGVITPEMTEAMLGAIAPDIMNAVRDAQQASSVAPLPPELQQALAGQIPAGGGEDEGQGASEPQTPPAEGGEPSEELPEDIQATPSEEMLPNTLARPASEASTQVSDLNARGVSMEDK
jgi:hypothetical protein